MISFRDVTFSYPDAELPALADATFEIPHGSFALVTGATGSGKSTLLRAINGLVPQFTGGSFSGEVTADGRSTREHAPRDLADVVAFVPQDPDSSFVLDRVEDELAYSMENLGVAPAQMRRRVEELVDLLGLESLRDRSVRSLSGGERQRVAIGGALAGGARVLVADEPTSQLDPQGAEDVLAALQRMVHDLGMTVVLAEHRLDRVVSFADVALRCDEGRVTIGSPAEIVGASDAGPPVVRLGHLLGWSPAPLTVRDARREAANLVLEEPVADPRPTGVPILRASNLSAGYGGEPVLTDIDLEVATGEIVAVLGRNGAGKTTLLRAFSGAHVPGSGTVTVGAEAPRPGRNVALCPQEPDDVLFRDTALSEVAVTLAAHGDERDPEEVLASFGLAWSAERHPRDLSAGQRLLVATAAIAATGARVLLLDEPTRGLDPSAKEMLAALMRHVVNDGAVVFATHDVELVASVATRVVMLAGGEVIADGDPGEVLGDSPVFSPQMTRVFGPGWLTPEQVAAAVAR